MRNAGLLLGSRIRSPLGELLALVDGEGALVRLDFPAEAGALEEHLRRQGLAVAWSPADLVHVEEQLRAYFRRELQRFALTLRPRGTPFQRRVWDELLGIPYGETISYRELAGRVGSPKAVRAVGRANATNPIAIVVPCHRVIGADGSLTGYGGGIERKRALLELEGATVALPPLFPADAPAWPLSGPPPVG